VSAGRVMNISPKASNSQLPLASWPGEGESGPGAEICPAWPSGEEFVDNRPDMTGRLGLIRPSGQRQSLRCRFYFRQEVRRRGAQRVAKPFADLLTSTVLQNDAHALHLPHGGGGGGCGNPSRRPVFGQSRRGICAPQRRCSTRCRHDVTRPGRPIDDRLPLTGRIPPRPLIWESRLSPKLHICQRRDEAQVVPLGMWNIPPEHGDPAQVR